MILDHGRVVGNASRTAISSDRRITGLSAGVIAELVTELGPLWHERRQAKLASRPRKRAVGAGAKHRLAFVDRLLATLVHLRHATTHDVLACWFGVDRSTITRAITEVRPLLAERGCTVSSGVRLRTLAEVIDHLGADGKTGIIDGTEIRVRRPAAGRKDRDRFISGKSKRNAVKNMVVTDGDGRVLFCSPTRPGSCADITHARQSGLVKLLADGAQPGERGYPGLLRRRDHTSHAEIIPGRPGCLRRADGLETNGGARRSPAARRRISRRRPA